MEGEQLSGPASSGLQQLHYRDLTLQPGACLSAGPHGVLAATSEDRKGRVAKKVDPDFFSGPHPALLQAPPLSPLLPSQSLLHCLDAALLPTLSHTSVQMCLCMCECVNSAGKDKIHTARIGVSTFPFVQDSTWKALKLASEKLLIQKQPVPVSTQGRGLRGPSS